MIAVKEIVYDVSESRLWKGGVYARRHKAGDDLTGFLKDAPRDASVLERMKRVGLLTYGTAAQPTVIKVFILNACFNLMGCFLLILILALWRW